MRKLANLHFCNFEPFDLSTKFFLYFSRVINMILEASASKKKIIIDNIRSVEFLEKKSVLSMRKDITQKTYRNNGAVTTTFKEHMLARGRG